MENKIELLDEMMNDLKKAPTIFRPGNFWSGYEPKIYNSLLKNDLNSFRRQPLAPGTVRSFGGGSDLGMYYGHHIFPFSESYRSFDESLPVKAYNKFLNQLAKLHPSFGLLSLRGSLGRRYFFDWFDSTRRAAYFAASLLDQDQVLSTIEDSKEGNPDLLKVDGKGYTLYFLEKFIEYCAMRQTIDFSKIKTVLEIGSGFGMQALILLKLFPHLNYCMVDIPPALYVMQQYLSANFPGQVLTYAEAKKLKVIDRKVLSQYKVVCLGTWLMERIQDDSFDLFINAESFQEMEPQLVENYLKEVKRTTSGYVYLKNLKQGHQKAEKGQHGVLEQTNRDHYLKFLSSPFKLLKENAANSYYGKTDYWQMIFRKNGAI